MKGIKHTIEIRAVEDPVEIGKLQDDLEREHRLGGYKTAGDRLIQEALVSGQRAGFLIWDASALKLKDREAWIGWDRRTAARHLKLIVNNSRFLVLDTERQPNLASAILGAAVRILPEQWEAKHGYRPVLAETFTDPEAHAGTCYKAAGWEGIGKTAGFGRIRDEYYVRHDRPKKLWVKPLCTDWRERLLSYEFAPEQKKGELPGAGVRLPVRLRQIESLAEALKKVPDPRRKGATLYPHFALLTVVCLGLMMGAPTISEIARIGQLLDERQRMLIGFRTKKGPDGRPLRYRPVPNDEVFRRILAHINLGKLNEVLNAWLVEQAGELPRMLAIDGKVIRQRLGCILSLVDHEDGTPVAQIATEDKGKELPALDQLLETPGLPIQSTVITGDALFACRDRAQQLVSEQGADYVLSIKGNQPKVVEHAQKHLADAPLF